MITGLSQFLANRGMKGKYNDNERNRFFVAAALVEDCGEDEMLMQVGKDKLVAAAFAEWKGEKITFEKALAREEVRIFTKLNFAGCDVCRIWEMPHPQGCGRTMNSPVVLVYD